MRYLKPNIKKLNNNYFLLYVNLLLSFFTKKEDTLAINIFYIRLLHIIVVCLGLCLSQQIYANQFDKNKKHSLLHPFQQKKTKPNLFLEARVYYGFLWQHHTELEPLKGHVPAFELSLLHKTFGKREWQKTHHYPYISYNLFYSPLTQHPALGKVYGMYPALHLPLYQTYKSYISFGVGLGLGYVTKHFHPINNYKNLAIGSYFNAFINVILNYRYHISFYTDISAGIGFVHFSNGGMASPNYGINLPMVSIGLSQKISPQNKRLLARRPSIPLFGYKDNRIFVYNLQFCYTTKDMGNVVGKRYNVYNSSFSILKLLNKTSALGISLDGVWDYSRENILNPNSDSSLSQPAEIFLLGVGPTYEVRFSNFIANIGFGWDGFFSKKTDIEFYETLALKYLAYKNIYLLVNLKANGGRAAFLGWGIGYRLQYDYGKIKNIP